MVRTRNVGGVAGFVIRRNGLVQNSEYLQSPGALDVEYMFDNPAVEGDEETGLTKVAYATGYRLPGRDQVFVVGSGMYPDE